MTDAGLRRPAACVEAMAETLSQKVLARVAGAKALYHRLILVTAPGGSGKTEVREVAEIAGSRLVNLNLELSRRMLDLTERELRGTGASGTPAVLQGRSR